MTLTKAPEFMKAKVIEGLQKNLKELQKFNTKYTVFGNNIEVLKAIKVAQLEIIKEINFQ